VDRMDHPVERMDQAVGRIDRATTACEHAAEACVSMAELVRDLVQAGKNGQGRSNETDSLVGGSISVGLFAGLVRFREAKKNSRGCEPSLSIFGNFFLNSLTDTTCVPYRQVRLCTHRF
jgi:hypothetical protein